MNEPKKDLDKKKRRDEKVNRSSSNSSTSSSSSDTILYFDSFDSGSSDFSSSCGSD